MKFQYRKEPVPDHQQIFGTPLLRPIIPIAMALENNTTSLEYQALIDSGADFCIFEAEIGEYLGLNIPTGKPVRFSGVQAAAGVQAFLHTITLNIGGYTYKTPAAFSYKVAPYGHGILGQHGFFDHFLVTFDFQKERVELKPGS